MATGKASEAAEKVAAPAATAAAAVPPVIADEMVRQVWPSLAVGYVVLAPDVPDGEFNGFWPARIASRSANMATLTWEGFDDLPAFSMPITSLALMHPAYKA